MHEGNVLLRSDLPVYFAFFLVTRSAYSRAVVRTSRKLSKSAWTKASGTRLKLFYLFLKVLARHVRRHLLAHSQRGAPALRQTFRTRYSWSWTFKQECSPSISYNLSRRSALVPFNFFFFIEDASLMVLDDICDSQNTLRACLCWSESAILRFCG